MFVSSYNTYIQADTSNKNERRRIQDVPSDSSFNSKVLEQQPAVESSLLSILPLDYVWSNKSLRNRFELERKSQKFQDSQNTTLNKQEQLTKELSSKQTLETAKVAYQENGQKFSLVRKPQFTMDQTPRIDTKLPQNVQELQEQNMRRGMVNTYISNDNYYKITA